MAQRQFAPKQLLRIREMLETVLRCLDEAQLEKIAIHVDMALNALDRELACTEQTALPNETGRTAAFRPR